MKIKVTVTVEVDVDAYCNTYGIPAAFVRRDVQEAAAGILHDRFTANPEFGVTV